jgi:HEPN domain-containing protein
MIDEGLKKWLIKAFKDYRTIENEFKFPGEEIVTTTVCFHAQQFVEKMLKAYLYSKGIEFGKTHNLKLLIKLCGQIDKNFSTLV